MSSYLTGARSARRTPETQPIMGREAEMVKNDAGGFAFEVDAITRLRRFLILGAEGGTYYAAQAKHVERNVQALEAALHADGERAVDEVVAVSVEGRAVRQDPVLFALAYAGAQTFDVAAQEKALRALPQVARTGYQLFMFAGFLSEMRGWGVRARKAVAAWYEQRDDVCPHCGGSVEGFVRTDADASIMWPEKHQCPCGEFVNVCGLRGVDWLSYQMIKYRQRDGWTHKRLIDLSHPKPPTAAHESLYQWALHYAKPDEGKEPMLIPEKVEGFQWAQLAESPADTVKVVKERPWLPWEALRTEHMSDPAVWRALLDNGLNMTALVRNLGRLTSYGVLKAMDAEYVGKVVRQLTDQKALTGARIHPLAILNATYVYHSGQGARMRWEPVSQILDALDEAFYLSFGAAEVANKRTLLAIDVSGSMTQACAGMSLISARAGAAAMALVTAARESAYQIVAFSSNRPVQADPWHNRGLAGSEVYNREQSQEWCIAPMDISPRMRLADAQKVMHDTQAGATDLSMPMLWAQRKAIDVDTFVIYTDNESFAGRMHPSQALKHYRQSTGIKTARLVIVAMTATAYSIADPRDPGMLDVVGFDTAAPNLITAFSRGEV